MKAVDDNKNITIYIYLFIIFILLAARYLRIKRRKEWVKIEYADGESVTTEIGATLLEISISNDIPHANLCHGKGRCGTCRVKIINTTSQLTKASKLEQLMLDKLNCCAQTRLACQVIPSAGVVKLERLFSADIQPATLHQSAEKEAEKSSHDEVSI